MRKHRGEPVGDVLLSQVQNASGAGVFVAQRPDNFVNYGGSNVLYSATPSTATYTSASSAAR